MDSLFRLGKKHEYPGALVSHDLMLFLFRSLWWDQTIIVFVVSGFTIHKNHVAVSMIVPDLMEHDLPGIARTVIYERHLLPIRE